MANMKTLRSKLYALAVLAIMVSMTAAAPTSVFRSSSVVTHAVRPTPTSKTAVTPVVSGTATKPTSTSNTVSRSASSVSSSADPTGSTAPCKRTSGSDGSNCPRPGSPEPPVLVTDDADEDTNPTEPAYVTTGTDTDGVETDNPEDYNPDDLLAAQKAFELITKTKRDLVERSPVDFRLIKSAIAPFKKYVDGFYAQDKSQQIIFYLKKSKSSTGDLKLWKGRSANAPPGIGTMNIEHVLEIQRIKTLFKRATTPPGVSAAAWNAMKVAVDDNTNSDTNPTKEALGGVLNAAPNLRGFQQRPNLLKGKVCTFIDKTNTGLATTSKGPNWAKIWARSEAFAAVVYLQATSKQYTASAKAVSDVVLTQTKDAALAAWVQTALADLHTKDLKAITDVVNKPIGKDGEVFKTEDMATVPKV